ncbi:MAG: exodeoxyribonuclease III [Clostridia bacterium]|nr:exodeoxyribonuclease III [Clostridia bacterium]MCR4906995.1 exodeoxyribonuclease III [Clostridiales bacterium]
MKFVSWNVNGFRSVLTKGFAEFFDAVDADVFSIQETKMQPGQAQFEREGYRVYYSSAEKKGYSGTAVFTRREPEAVFYGIDGKYSDEGRLITLDFGNLYLVNSYTPNVQRELTRLDYRMVFEDDLRAYLSALDREKPVVLCGDLNVAHEEIDLKNAKSNIGNAGFTDEERGKMTELLAAGFTDSFRFRYPDRTDAYTWWSYMFKAREHNTGWRIDYFIVSDRLRDAIGEARIYPEVLGSDHCPVGLTLAE